MHIVCSLLSCLFFLLSAKAQQLKKKHKQQFTKLVNHLTCNKMFYQIQRYNPKSLLQPFRPTL